MGDGYSSLAAWCSRQVAAAWRAEKIGAATGRHDYQSVRPELVRQLVAIDPGLAATVENPGLYANPQSAAVKLEKWAALLAAMAPAAAMVPASPEPAPPAASGAESPAKVADETVGRLLHLVGDGTGVKVLSIARDQAKPANDRLVALVNLDRRFDGYNSTQWGELLGVTPEAIRQTEFWKTRKKRREGL
jgi:hypothetical protein